MVFEKGHIKSGGKKKGSVNKVTRLQQRLKETPDQRREIMEQLWGLALGIRDKGCANACRVWIAEYNKQADDIIANPLDVKLETLEDVNKASQEIHEQMLRSELPISVGERMLITLTARQKHIEAQLDPVIKECIEDKLAELKMKG